MATIARLLDKDWLIEVSMLFLFGACLLSLNVKALLLLLQSYSPDEVTVILQFAMLR